MKSMAATLRKNLQPGHVWNGLVQGHPALRARRFGRVAEKCHDHPNHQAIDRIQEDLGWHCHGILPEKKKVVMGTHQKKDGNIWEQLKSCKIWGTYIIWEHVSIFFWGLL